MFDYKTIWDLYEIKFVIFFVVSAVLSIWVGNYLYDKTKKNNKDMK